MIIYTQPTLQCPRFTFEWKCGSVVKIPVTNLEWSLLKICSLFSPSVANMFFEYIYLHIRFIKSRSRLTGVAAFELL